MLYMKQDVHYILVLVLLLLLQFYLLSTQSGGGEIKIFRDCPHTDLGVLSGLVELIVLKETLYLAVSVS